MATQTVQAVDHKLLLAGEWIETGPIADGYGALERLVLDLAGGEARMVTLGVDWRDAPALAERPRPPRLPSGRDRHSATRCCT